MSLNIKKNFEQDRGVWEMELNGEIDIYTATELKSTFQEMFEEKKEPVEIDLENLEYIDSTGLGVLIGALKRLREEDKDISLFHVKPNILKLLNITGLNKIFIIKE
jgi:anti-sigma B factor antagonist